MTDIEKVRLLIGTVISATYTDAQIQAFLDMGISVYGAAALALKSWAATVADVSNSEKIGDYSYTKTSVANAIKLAENYEKKDAEQPAVAWAEWDFDATGGPEFSEV